MSSTDPFAAIRARVAAAEAAMLEAAINFGVSADALQAQISLGDILAAKILPPQNGQDLIEIAGQRVAAQLPPGVHPGETLLLQVTAFAGTQILVRNLGLPDPRNPLPVTDIVLRTPETQIPGQTAVLTTIRTTDPPQEPPQNPAPQNAVPPQRAQTTPVSPPREVFVAASVRQASPPQTSPAPAAAPPVPGVEARIAAAQAAKLPLMTVKESISAALPAAPESASAPAPAPASAQKTSIPPLIPARSAAGAAAVVQRAVQTVSEFLRAARLPDTPFTRMAATIAPHAPERVPSVLKRLEAALPRVSQDARVQTLRTLIGFTARLNAADAETLRAQISSYVSNVIEGVEAKLAQLLQAHMQATARASLPAHADAPAAPQPPQPSHTAPPAQDSQTAQISHQEPESAVLSPAAAQARVAERAAAISHDLKSVVLSLLRDPPADRTPAMTQALSETLITLTGAQVNALSSSQQSPGTFSFTLPVYYHEGGKPAQIRISRDAESRAAKMDADNFHVAFVLDTANLGTVAIDLQTTGRTVKVDVKTARQSAAARFSDTLSSLRARLEDLRYRVSSAVASALPAPAANVPGNSDVPSPSKDAPQKERGLDLRA